MKDKALEIINHYGVNHQLRKLQEEVFEFNEAIIEREIHWNNDTGIQDITPLDNHILEEMADVMVLLTQFKEHYNISVDEIENIMSQKIDRQVERIKEESDKE